MGSSMAAVLKDMQPRGATLTCNLQPSLTCNIEVVHKSTFRVSFCREAGFRQPNTWTILSPSTSDVPWEGINRASVLADFPIPFFSSDSNTDSLTLKTSSLGLTVQLSPLRLTWQDGAGRTFATDRLSRPYSFAKKTQGVRHCMERQVGDEFFGLGDKTGGLNLAGRRLRTMMTDALGYDPQTGDPLYKHWPYCITRDAATGIYYGMLYDNIVEATFDFGCEHSNYYGLYRSYEAVDGDLDYYLMMGPTLADVIRSFAVLTGGMRLGPRWSLGYHCTAMPLADAPDAQERIEEFIVLCQKYSIPCSAFHFGSGYTSIDNKRYVFNWNLQKFPDPKTLIRKFGERGIRVVANLKPCLLSDHPRFDEVSKAGAFIQLGESGEPSMSQFWDGEGAHLDFTNPAAIEWWQKNLQKYILDYGMSSAWNDNNEYELWEEDATCHGFGHPTPLSLTRPLHSLLMTRASLEQQVRSKPEERAYTVSRAGCFGVQRYAQTWSGDNTTSWATLRYNLRTGLQLSLSGLFNIGHDVGGFAGPSPSPELLVRWVQTGLLHPRFIMNSWKSDGAVTSPWLHPSVLPFVRFAIRLRYRLLPYLYTLYCQACETHVPIVRPSFFDFPDDAMCRKENDEMMLGPSLLAAPVVEEGKRQRTVYLPKTPNGWFDFYSEEWYPGGEIVTVAAPLERLPLFVLGGSALPMTAEAEDFGRLHDEQSRIFRLFPRPLPPPKSLAQCSPSTSLSGLVRVENDTRGTSASTTLTGDVSGTGGAGLSDNGASSMSQPLNTTSLDESHIAAWLWEDDGLSVTKEKSGFRLLEARMRSNESAVSFEISSSRGSFPLPYQIIHLALPMAELRPLKASWSPPKGQAEEEGGLETIVKVEAHPFRLHALS
eukprot:TRINITY_DN38564_c0_g1_i1.p1 TRINITY_DN38564_c0_g1~~TRINITY_DN38564_c0_g1_i1.p1  ORF type:complete len:880 (+),score=112.87 TRINITY_DN38564_c0_g1_i1:332-2971(+)